MKQLKMLGLAVTAAVALGAFGGTGSASATEACKATESPCAAANMYGAGQEYHGVLTPNTHFTFTGSLSITCKKSTFKASQENTGDAIETVKLKFEALTIEECSVAGVCATATVTTNIQPTIEIHTEPEEGPDNGTVTMKGFTTTVVCGGITCKYSGEILTGLTIRGGNPAELIVGKAPLPVEKASEEFFCGKQAEIDATYEITTPNPLWII